MTNKKKTFSRREFLKASSLAVASAGMMPSPLFAAAKRTPAAGKVKIGVIVPSHCALSMIHAQLAGHYRKNGINAELVFFHDISDIAEGLIKGELDVGQLISPVFFALHTGNGPFKGKATPLVTAQIAGTNGGVLVVHSNSNIRSPKQLKGKTVGVHSPLMVHNLLVNELLSYFDIDPSKDLTIETIQMDQLTTALKEGKIQAFVNPEPLPTFSKSKGLTKELILTKKLWPNHPCCVVSVRKDFYEKEPETVKAIFLSSIESGLQLNNEITRKDIIERIHKDSKPYQKFPLSALQEAFGPDRSDFGVFPYESSGKVLLSMMNKYNLLPDSVLTDDVVKATFLSNLSRKLIASLGGHPPVENVRSEKLITMG